jgi:hypothetical protein
MANPSFPIAGNWDPTEFKKIFPAQGQSFYGSPQTSQDRIFEIYEKYKIPQEDLSKLPETERLIARHIGFNPVEAAMTSELQRVNAEYASRLSRENIDYATAKQREYESKRDKERFQYGMLASIPGMIGEAFAAPGKYALMGSQMGTQSLANVLNTPSASFQSVSPQYQKYLS